jgi:gamma-glutamyl:cysteine ligase YbdK (ATP-grasp superfamily)
MPLRKLGVEEELFLLDPEAGKLAAASCQAIQAARADKRSAASGAHPRHTAMEPVEEELFRAANVR